MTTPYIDKYDDVYAGFDFPVAAIEVQFTPGTWTDITPYFDAAGGGAVSIARGANTVESPVVRYDAGTASVPLNNSDRRFDPTNLAGPYVSGGVTQVLPRAAMRFSATYASTTYRLFRGTADSWTVSYSQPSDSVTVLAGTDGFKILGVQARKAQASFLGAGEDSGQRVTRILDDCGWSATDRNITHPGSATLQATLLGGTPPAVLPDVSRVAIGGPGPSIKVQQTASTSTPIDELQLTNETELGELYVDGAGLLTFRSRSAFFTDTRTRFSQATFGDDPAVPTSELPYADVVMAYDDSTLYNGAIVANAGGVLQAAADSSSQATYGPRVYDSESLIADSDWQALNYAQYIVAFAAKPELRFSQLMVDPMAAPGLLFPQVLGRQLGDRITVNRRPPGGGATITRDCIIRGIAHQFTDSTWLTTWTLQDASRIPAAFIIGDPVNGVIGVSLIGY